MTNISAKGTLGGANLTELAKISAKAFQVVDENDIAPFELDWHEVFDRWGAGASPAVQGSLVLIFLDTAQVVGSSLGCETIYQFGMKDVAEPGVYLVSKSATGNAWRIPGSSADHQENCSKISASGLADQVAVVLGVRTGHFLVLPAGIDGTSWSVNLNCVSPTLDDAILTEHLNVFAVENLNSAETRSDLWIDASQWIPKEQAERIIQKLLLVGLRTALTKHSVIPEPSTAIGRLDLLVLSKDPSDPDRYVLELKAVRSHTSTGTAVTASAMVTHLSDGVDQADQYRKKVGGKSAYLCVYDMRRVKGGDVIEKTKPKCANTDVRLRVFDVHNASKTARKAAATA
ncbi:PD-(D/E)XK nuclease superfamily protein [Janthinobacterium sp. 61]|uniref:hypothetical protein n=1 Tax=Janthinobacterium sp. 61 TaxID=2035209 RepID=UPI000C7150E6|nr:hypothetical protein [Janthinobacterium sp. 61]PKV47615.1 PD-(D/E)XK nuclease superfamily protein [Janthinobacterium sp. 61]